MPDFPDNNSPDLQAAQAAAAAGAAGERAGMPDLRQVQHGRQAGSSRHARARVRA